MGTVEGSSPTKKLGREREREVWGCGAGAQGAQNWGPSAKTSNTIIACNAINASYLIKTSLVLHWAFSRSRRQNHNALLKHLHQVKRENAYR